MKSALLLMQTFSDNLTTKRAEQASGSGVKLAVSETRSPTDEEHTCCCCNNTNNTNTGDPVPSQTPAPAPSKASSAVSARNSAMPPNKPS